MSRIFPAPLNCKPGHLCMARRSVSGSRRCRLARRLPAKRDHYRVAIGDRTRRNDRAGRIRAGSWKRVSHFLEDGGIYRSDHQSAAASFRATRRACCRRVGRATGGGQNRRHLQNCPPSPGTFLQISADLRAFGSRYRNIELADAVRIIDPWQSECFGIRYHGRRLNCEAEADNACTIRF